MGSMNMGRCRHCRLSLNRWVCSVRNHTLASVDRGLTDYCNRPSIKPASQTANDDREDDRTDHDFDLAYHNLVPIAVAQYTIRSTFLFRPNSSSVTHEP